VNGQQRTLDVASGGNNGRWFKDINDLSTLTDMYIGVAEGFTATVKGGYLGGSIDEVAIWNRALASNEVHQIYSSPLYLDYKE
jgi:hypothetical protein